MKLPFRTTINIALGVGLSLIVMSVATSYITINALIRDAQEETQTQETVISLERLVSQFKTAESLQRRYLLTATEPDLAAYQQARERIQQALPRVHSVPTLTDRNQDLHTLEGLIAQRMELMKETVAARQQSGLAAAAALVGSDLNRQLHEEIDGLVNRIKSAETVTFERSKEETRQTAQKVKLLILLGGLLSLSIPTPHAGQAFWNELHISVILMKIVMLDLAVYPKSGYRDFPRSQAPVVDYFFLGDGIFCIGVK